MVERKDGGLHLTGHEEACECNHLGSIELGRHLDIDLRVIACFTVWLRILLGVAREEVISESPTYSEEYSNESRLTRVP